MKPTISLLILIVLLFTPDYVTFNNETFRVIFQLTTVIQLFKALKDVVEWLDTNNYL